MNLLVFKPCTIYNQIISKQGNLLWSVVFVYLHCTHFDYCNIFVLYDIHEALNVSGYPLKYVLKYILLCLLNKKLFSFLKTNVRVVVCLEKVLYMKQQVGIIMHCLFKTGLWQTGGTGPLRQPANQMNQAIKRRSVRTNRKLNDQLHNLITITTNFVTQY